MHSKSKMIHTCQVCGEPAAGFHFGAFTCEGCKSFFGRSCKNTSLISECKNSGKCVIDKKNRTTCKACRLRKCCTVGMSKEGSRYGRRSNWFKIHCLLQQQQQQAVEAVSKEGSTSVVPTNLSSAFGNMTAAAWAAQQQFSHRSSHMTGDLHFGYPSLMPDISAAPFIPAANIPFFSMMNSLPTMAAGPPPSLFQMTPHLLFPGYEPAAASAAADTAYRPEMYEHRQSVDSPASTESLSRFSPTNRSQNSSIQEEHHITRQSPELCVSEDDEKLDYKSLHLQNSLSPISSVSNSYQEQQKQQIHFPVPIKASPIYQTTPEHLFAAKMQSLSPVSVCSISNETSSVHYNHEEPMNKDCPIDLSMKTSRSSLNSDIDMLSNESSEEERQQNLRRKFFELENSNENCESSADSEIAKKQKLPENVYNIFSSQHRGIVCV